MRGIIAVGMFVGACGAGRYDLQPIAAHDSACTFEICSLMAGSETFGRSAFYSDVDEGVELAEITVSPPELAQVSVDHEYFTVVTPPGAEGFGTFHVVTADGYRYEHPFKVRPSAGSAIVPDGDYVPLETFPGRRLPGERLAIFEAEQLLLVLEHRAVDGELLLGHTTEPWSASGVQLAEVDPTWTSVDRALLRTLRVTQEGPGSVSAGASSLPIDVVRPGTTSRIDLYRTGGGPELTELRTYAGHHDQLAVVAYAADGRFIYGGPPYLPLAVDVADPAVVSVEEERFGLAQRRVTLIAGDTAGATTVQIRFDGALSTLPVVVD